MICRDFDPITASCAPSCCVCSQKRECTNLERSRERSRERSAHEAQKKAAPDATNIQSGRVEKGLPTVFSTSKFTK